MKPPSYFLSEMMTVMNTRTPNTASDAKVSFTFAFTPSMQMSTNKQKNNQCLQYHYENHFDLTDPLKAEKRP